jgi:ABC-type amino acid transport substrate-binding protein
MIRVYLLWAAMLWSVFGIIPAQALVTTKPIVIGILYDPPFVYNTSTGFDVEMMKNICVSQNVQCQFRQTTLDAALADLKGKTGKMDAAVGAISITAQRALTLDFVGPYYRGTMSLLARKGQLSDTVSLSTLTNQTIGVERASIFYQYLAEVAHTDKHLKIYEDDNDLLQALSNEEVDAIALDTPVAQYWQQKSHCKLHIIGPATQIPQDQGYGIVLRQHDKTLKKLFHQGFQDIQRQGELQRLIQLYFSDFLSICEP